MWRISLTIIKGRHSKSFREQTGKEQERMGYNGGLDQEFLVEMIEDIDPIDDLFSVILLYCSGSLSYLGNFTYVFGNRKSW